MATHTASDSSSVLTLDFDSLLNHAGGDPELLVRLCRVFLCELPQHLEQLRKAFTGADLHRAGRALFRLQNCIVLFGAGHASLTAQALEGAMVTRRMRSVQREWLRLEEQLRELTPQVQRLLLEMSNPGTLVQ
jgi:HPt (histidine-containing phosphotransfer) domain-containing protein